MARYARKKTTKKSYGRYTRRKSMSKRSVVSPSIKRYVKKTVHGNLENKEKMNYVANTSLVNGDTSSTTYPMLMNIIQGTGSADRSGNQTRIVKGIFKGCINLLPYSLNTNPNPQPTWVRILLVRDLKISGQASSLGADAYANLFRINNGTVSVQGNPLDMNLEVNKDYFRVLYDKVVKLGSANNTSGGYPSTSNFSDNSPMAHRFIINWGKHCKKQLKYNDNSGYPTNENLYLIFISASADGSSSTGKVQTELHYCNYQHFEDA